MLPLLKKVLSTEIFLAVDGHDPKLVQQAIGGIEVDGVIGYQTTNALLALDKTIFLSKLFDLVTNKQDIPPPSSKKDTMMAYLGRYEGTVVHWNKTESSYTTPYGVYRKLFPKAQVVLYIDKRAKELGINLRRRNTRELAKLNRLLTRKDKDIIKDLAYEFMLSHFVDKRVEPYLDAKETLTFFSLSVNGGAGRGRKALQSALGVKVDGKIGKQTLGKLEARKGSLNEGMLSYMRGFYLRLIQRNPSKYAIYKRGWMNRLKGLA